MSDSSTPNNNNEFFASNVEDGEDTLPELLSSPSFRALRQSLENLGEGKAQRQQMKEDQCRILTSHNSELMASLDRAEQELETLHRERRKVEQENKALRDTNYNLQARANSAEGLLEEATSECEDVQVQLKTMMTKSAELFSLLEREEANTSKITTELESCKRDSQCLGEKYSALIQASRESEEAAQNAIRENRLKTDEIRVLRVEVDQLKQKSSDLTIKSTVDLEALNEQLRLRKEKQYQLLGKLQSQEEASRQAEDRMKELEQKIKDLRQQSAELQTALQLETNARISQDTSNRTLTIDFQATSAENKELRSKLQEFEQVRLKLEAEARDNGEQLREMAEKVFQLLERLKLTELGKKKSMEALTKRDQESLVLKKQQAKIAEDSANQRRSREKLESEKQVIEDQLRCMQKVNSQLGQKLKDEAKSRIKEEEACKEANEKVRILDGRLAFLLSKLQTDEEARSSQQEDMKKIELQLQTVTQRCDHLQTKLTEAEECARDATVKMQESDKLLKETSIKHQSLEQTLALHDEQSHKDERKAILSKAKPIAENNLAGGQLRFFVDNRPSLGHAVITGKTPKDKVWIEETGCNILLRKILKSQNSQELLLEKVAKLYGAILFGEEQLEKANFEMKAREEDMHRLDRELNLIQTEVMKQEESKRRILLRYIRAVKASVSMGEPGCEEDRNEVGGVGAGKIILPESSLSDEEIHVIVSMLRNNVTIEELQFRRNNISDDGARALAAVLAERSALKFIDLRENHVSMAGMRAIADALERSARVHKVMVHPGGKIEAFGASETVDEGGIADSMGSLAMKTVCIVDIRENKARDESSVTNKSQKKKLRPRKSAPVNPELAHSPTSKRQSATAPIEPPIERVLSFRSC